MPKTVSATEAKVKLGTIMDWAVDNQEEVVVESRGTPRVVIIPFGEYEQYRELRERARREAAFARLQQIAEEAQARNQDLSQEEANRLAHRFTRDVVDDMVAEGKIKFQEF